MNPDRIRKIQALADDARGDPATRARAQEKLAAYRKSHPHLFAAAPKFHDVPPPDPRVYGMRVDPAYEYYVFTDLSLWNETRAGNKTTTVYHKNIHYRIVLFQHKKSPTWGWMRVDNFHQTTVFSGRFKTQGEAHSDSWADLMAV